MTYRTQAEALREPHTEVSLNGRCVGQLYWDEKYGTSLQFIWHDPKGCEHTTQTLECGCVVSQSRTERMCRYHQTEDDAIYRANERRRHYDPLPSVDRA